MPASNPEYAPVQLWRADERTPRHGRRRRRRGDTYGEYVEDDEEDASEGDEGGDDEEDDQNNTEILHRVVRVLGLGGQVLAVSLGPLGHLRKVLDNTARCIGLGLGLRLRSGLVSGR